MVATEKATPERSLKSKVKWKIKSKMKPKHWMRSAGSDGDLSNREDDTNTESNSKEAVTQRNVLDRRDRRLDGGTNRYMAVFDLTPGAKLSVSFMSHDVIQGKLDRASSSGEDVLDQRDKLFLSR